MSESLELNDICIICNGASGLRSLSEDHFYMGIVENYNSMLEECFNIKFTAPADETVDIMCMTCAGRLRQCLEFKKDVEAAHSRFTLYLKKGKYALKRNLKNMPPAVNTRSSRSYLLENLKQDVYYDEVEYDFDFDTNDYLESCDSDSPKDYYDAIVEVSIDKLKSDDEWSVTSGEMDRATGHPIKLTQKKPQRLKKDATECPICSIQIANWKSLSLHYEKHTPQSLCHFCGYKSVKGQIGTHLETHRDIRYPCTQCERTFKLKNSLKQHVRIYHLKEKLNKCTVCNMRFGDSRARRHHMMKEHGANFRMLKCSFCERSYFSQYYLRIHEDSVHYKKKNVFCSICGFGFFSNADLKSHLLTHTAIKNHECEYCGKCFRKKYHLKTHMKIHLDIRNFKCDHCDKSFVQKCALQGHLKTHRI